MKFAPHWQNRIIESGVVSPDDLVANPKNWRKHPKNQADAMEGVLDEIGWVQDVIVNRRTGRLIDGHLRVELAKKNKEKEIPIKYVDLSEEEEEIAILSFDPISAMAEADKNMLEALLASVQTDNEQVNKLMGDIAQDYKIHKKAEEDDYEPPAEIETDIQRGDIYQLGRHWVMCGDSTSREDVERLMDGKKAALCLTDPPYGVGEDYDQISDTEENLKELIEGFLPLAQEHAEITLLTPGNKNHWFYPKPSWTLCWFVAAATGLGPWGFTCWQPILAYGADPFHKRCKGSMPDGIAITQSADNSLGHPCSKPIKVWSWFLERGSLNKNDLVLDPFLGSGTTLIACEQLDRICYGMEISPQYCEIICLRWEKLTGGNRQNVNGDST
jgi:DNA modification methylase